MIVRIQNEPINEAALLAGFGRGAGVGAMVSFSGRVRADGAVSALELESYPGFTEAEVEREAALIAADHALLDLIAVHRIGRVPCGETVVFVAAAAAHRREAFEAADRLMDWLKTAAPLWKKEHAESGVRWIEPTARDHADAARWSAQ